MPRKLKPSLVRWIAIKVERTDLARPVTWAQIEAITKEKTAGLTRQWLCKQPRIAAAYEAQHARSRGLKEGGTAGALRPSARERSQETIRRLRLALVERDRELAKYDGMLASMLLAARDAQVPQELLMRPLPPTMRSARPHLVHRRKRKG